jgi:hypothetical protein
MRLHPSLLITGAVLASLALNAQQPTPNYSFHAALRTGSTSINQTVTEDTVFSDCPGPKGDTTLVAMEIDDAADVASVLRWYDETKNARPAAVYVGSQCVAQDGDVLDGRILAGISGSIVIKAGKVAYEARYKDRADSATSRYGVFVDRSYAVDIDPTGASPHFTLTDDGKVVVRTRSSATVAKDPSTATSLAKKYIHRPKILDKLRIPTPAANKAATRQKSGTPTPNSTAQTCPLPDFPFPANWNPNSAGPVTSRRLDAPGFRSEKGRMVYYDAECHPVLIALLDGGVEGSFDTKEARSPNGLLAVADSNGVLKSGELSEPAANFIRPDTLLRINSRGQIAIGLTYNRPFPTILLATPTH